MTGDRRTIDFLCDQLSAELTGASQYLLHATVLERSGFGPVAARSRVEAGEEMRHAELLAARMADLGVLPGYSVMPPVLLGTTLRDMFEADLGLEQDAVDRLREALDHLCRVGNEAMATLFEAILAEQEGHLDYLESSLARIDEVGEAAFAAEVG